MFWVVPSVSVVLSIGLAIGLVVLDQHLGRLQDSFLYPGPPGGARSLLSSIVTAMITFTGMVFSVSIVVLQLTNGQFSSRVVRIYLRDVIVQLTLGMCMASFVYAMVVLRTVQGGGGQAPFVPRIAVTVSLVLVIATIGVFIQYVSHVANMARVATIVRYLGNDSHRCLEARYPAGLAPPEQVGSLPSASGTISAQRSGVLVSLNEDRLVELAGTEDCVLRFVPRLGDFVATGAPLCEVLSDGGRADRRDAPRGSEGPDTQDAQEVQDDDARWEKLRVDVERASAFDSERTMEQDLAFGIRQLVDIAERALSPSLNDPTTATQCLDVLHDLLRQLAGRVLPDGVHRGGDGAVRLVVPQYDFGDLLDLALTEIWHYGSDGVQVPARLSTLVDDLGAVAIPEHQEAVRRWEQRLRDGSAR
ncbi:MAG: DUF2254 domain-containing protein [Acidimicrobiales bacterium]